jgi:2-polyprenyl-3-methyl-5-hydroxy-6-metoxy-1,4-benzoquinol methylase
MSERAVIDTAKLEAFVGRGVGDVGALMSAALVVIGDKLGLFRAMAGAGPLSAAELAARTGTAERYIREWLINQAASGYLDYDPAVGCYTLPDEHAVALTDEASPYFLAGCFQSSLAIVKAEARIAEAFRSGKGMLWGEHDAGLFTGAERGWGPGYRNFLVSDWIPALGGVEARLRAGATVADVGCGHGVSTIVMARAFPQSRFFGFDNHAPSIEQARRSAAEAGVADRVTFSVAAASAFPGSNYDLICYFDCLHDMGDPAGAIRHAAATLAPDGTVLLVEPMAGRRVEDNLNPVGRVMSGFSVLCCTPNALAACDCDEALGTIATDDQLQAVVRAGGLTQFRRVAETPLNRVFAIKR